MRVLGIDAAGRHGWVAVLLERGRFVDARVGGLDELVAWAEPVQVIAVDIPIGQVAGDVRRCDLEAKAFLGAARSSVFPAPPAAVLTIDDYALANEQLSARGAPKMSRQAWALIPRVVETARLAAHDERVREVHPEVSFREMTGGSLGSSKKSWTGLARRHIALEDVGISLPGELPGAGHVPADDVVDAAAAAWSAHRIATGVARSLPPEPETPVGDAPSGGGGVAIWV